MTDPNRLQDPQTPGVPDQPPPKTTVSTWVAGGVAIALVLVGALVFWNTRPQTTLVPAPPPDAITASPTSVPTTASATPTPTRSATATPTPSKKATPQGGLTTAPASLGELPPDVKLLHEGTPADGPTSAWEPSAWGYGCPGHVASFPSFRSLTASRSIQAVGPEWAASESILVFADAPAAKQFMTEIKAANEACNGPAGEPDVRIRTAVDQFNGTWDLGLALRSWDEVSTDGGTTWNPRPGAGLDLVVMRGKAVAISSQGGEYVGDPLKVESIITETREAIDAIAPSMCAFTTAGC